MTNPIIKRIKRDYSKRKRQKGEEATDNNHLRYTRKRVKGDSWEEESK